ncbi:SAM-dependent methyltransferase [Actinospica sp.]|uniref:SAM-dependent methyltransferase n=1 Tax=Actinospica sp. TaxID=1872142 RepID=UPI002BC25292|nr:SAM-dependent methyltransferase [Actinospica sp.]HWG25822.1 SAM-dependent methyltransferase [Actinospica sp.]
MPEGRAEARQAAAETAATWDLVLGAPAPPAPALDPEMPHPIRMWDYMIGGKDNYESDRAAVRHLLNVWPDVMLIARAAEAFAHRASDWIARDHGLRQYLQMGTSIPIMNSFDGIVRDAVPDARFVYVTDDPITAAHARAVLAARAPSNLLHVLQAQFRDPAQILAHPWLRERLDFSEPMGVLLLGMLDYTRDDARLKRALEEIMEALAPGSLVLVLHYLEFPIPRVGEIVQSLLGDNKAEFTPRSMETIEEMVAAYEFLPPGLVRITSWNPDGHGPGQDMEERCHIVGGVIVKQES